MDKISSILNPTIEVERLNNEDNDDYNFVVDKRMQEKPEEKQHGVSAIICIKKSFMMYD